MDEKEKTDKSIYPKAVTDALKSGLRVELILQKDGSVTAQTVHRKKLNIEPTA